MIRHLLDALENVDIYSLIEAMVVLPVPTAFALLVWYKSRLVNSFGRKIAVLALLSLFGWAVVVIYIFFGKPPENGFAYFSALVFGWMYAWLIGVPVIIIWLSLMAGVSVARRIRRKVMGIEPSGRPPMWAVILLLFASLVVYPIFLSCPRDATWNDWDDRQYRVVKKDNLVHIEIREGESIVDVDTRASIFSRYAVEVSSKDELLLKSSDIGNWLIGRQNGRWRVYVRENGGIRCIDNEILKD